MKLSVAAADVAEKSVAAMRLLIDRVVDEFGADRTLVGSEFPVGSRVGWS